MRLYSQTIETIRKEEYPQLKTATYLDHGGTTLYAKSVIETFSHDMTASLFGNPHSASPSSQLSTQKVDKVRERVLKFFKADSDDFDVIFVGNASAAIKLVADAFVDSSRNDFWYGYHTDAHTSLVGIRQLAARSRCFYNDEEVEEWLELGEEYNESLRLFAYPAQSNMNGHRLPMTWSARAQKHQNTYTLLDAAALVLSAQLDLSDTSVRAPDFTVLSFYKIFGFPDLGALIVRKSSAHVLKNRRYFGGGTVDMIVNGRPWHAKKEQIHEQHEEGTLPFHSIIALGIALDIHEKLYGCMDNISKHTTNLAKVLHKRLNALRHYNNTPVCEIYKHPQSQYGNPKTQGPTIAFNIRTSEGDWVGKSEVERLAVAQNIHLRTGGVCNPGGIATYCDLEPHEMRRNFFDGSRCGNNLDILRGKPTGVVRISLGAMSSMKDVEKFLAFIEETFVQGVPTTKHTTVSPEIIGKISKLRIYPVRGCLPWEIPTGLSWDLSDTGLSYDDEWCIVSPTSHSIYGPITCSKISTLQPQLYMKEGYLTLSCTSRKSVKIPLWDILGTERVVLAQNGQTRPADIYHSESFVNFFTSVLGVESTLARFALLNESDIVQVPSLDCLTHNKIRMRPTTLMNQISCPALAVTECTITLSSLLLVHEPINISLSPTELPRQSSGYLKINQLIFQIRPMHGHSDAVRLHLVTHSNNPSPASLRPQIQVGDAIHLHQIVNEVPNIERPLSSDSRRVVKHSKISLRLKKYLGICTGHVY